MKYITKLNCHPTQQTLRDFAASSLGQEEMRDVADHIASCVPCTRAFSVIAGEHPAEAPAGFEEEIRSRIAREEEKKTELFRFSFRVAAAACAAFFLIFIGALNAAGPRNPLPKIEAPSFSAVDNISTHLRDFSQKILDMEVFQHAETEK